MFEYVVAREFREIQVRDKDNEEIHYDNRHDKDGKDTEKGITYITIV